MNTRLHIAAMLFSTLLLGCSSNSDKFGFNSRDVKGVRIVDVTTMNVWNIDMEQQHALVRQILHAVPVNKGVQGKCKYEIHVELNTGKSIEFKAEEHLVALTNGNEFYAFDDAFGVNNVLP